MINDNSYPWNFLGLERELSDCKSSKVAVLPIPYEGTVSYKKGTKLAPHAIIDASRQVETYDRDLDSEPCSVGIATLDEVDSAAVSPKEMMDRIESIAGPILNDDKFLLTLGGEHSITGPIVKTHKSKYKDISVLQIDAHSDLRDEYQGSPYSHACVMSRVWQHCEFVSVGIRSFCGSDNEKRAWSENRIFTPEEYRSNRDSVSKILSMLTDHVYITVDLDGFDPSVIPAVGTPEPGGLLWHEVLNLIKQVGREKEIVGADVVELSPITGMIHPDFTAALLAYKIIGIAFNRKE